jgi:hypothetical protein
MGCEEVGTSRTEADFERSKQWIRATCLAQPFFLADMMEEPDSSSK